MRWVLGAYRSQVGSREEDMGWEEDQGEDTGWQTGKGVPYPKGLAVLHSHSFLPFGNKGSVSWGFVLVFKEEPKSGFLW